VQSAGLGRHKAGCGEIGIRSHLLGVGRLGLEELTLECVQLDLAIGDDHAAGHGKRERNNHDDARLSQ
jgi:hypothetical protein